MVDPELFMSIVTLSQRGGFSVEVEQSTLDAKNLVAVVKVDVCSGSQLILNKLAAISEEFGNAFVERTS